MESKGTVLFIRGEENSEDDNIWDDTALITAYDKAIGTAKELIKERRKTSIEPEPSASGGSASESTGSSHVDKVALGSKRRHRNRKLTHNYNKNTNSQNSQRQNKKQWSVGDRCCCVYSGDGLLYEAEILSIDSAVGSCIVSYVDYGNEEEIYLNDLRPVSDLKNVPKQIKKSTRKQNSNPLGVDNENAKKNSMTDNSHFGNSQQGPSNHQPQVPQFSPWPVPNSINIPPMAMPPPLPIFNDGAENDDDAMASMLMAWYMCGYHSGYYQGLKQNKR